jgi:hypothetical protein
MYNGLFGDGANYYVGRVHSDADNVMKKYGIK